MKKTLMTATAAFLMTFTASATDASDNRTTLRFHTDASLVEGSRALGAGDYEIARKKLRKALRHHLTDVERLTAANNLCIAEQNLGNLEAALGACKKAVKADRHSWQAHVNLGNVYIAMGNKEDALKSWNRAVRISKKAKQAEIMLAAIQKPKASQLAQISK